MSIEGVRSSSPLQIRSKFSLKKTIFKVWKRPRGFFLNIMAIRSKFRILYKNRSWAKFVNLSGAQKSIPPAYVAWWNPFLDSFNVYKFGLWIKPWKLATWGRIQRKTRCMGLYAGAEHNPHLMSTPTHLSWATLCQSLLYPLVRDFGFGICHNTTHIQKSDVAGYNFYNIGICIVVNKVPRCE